MTTINVRPGRMLPLGREGEHLTRQIVFDVSAWRDEYGDGTVSLIAQRSGDTEPYPCTVTADGSAVTWLVTAADTAQAGYGRCELRYAVEDVLVKSDMWRTYTADALGTPTPEPPEPQKAWVDKVLAAGQAAVDASVNSPKIGSNGNWFVWDFEAGAYVDTGVAASGGVSAVSSVNGQTGEVMLTAGDVGAATAERVEQLAGEIGGKITAPATAQVGQTIRIKAVDEAGCPTEWEAADMAAGGDGGKWKLLARYVHSGNVVVQPDGLDIETGIWTVSAGHGLKTGDLVCPILNFWQERSLPSNYNAKIPVGIFNQTTYGIKVTVIDDTTFTLHHDTSNSPAPKYSNATEVDCSLFHFEVMNSNNRGNVSFSGLSGYDSLKLRIYGQAYSSVTFGLVTPSDGAFRLLDNFSYTRIDSVTRVKTEYTSQKVNLGYAGAIANRCTSGEGSYFLNYDAVIEKIEGGYVTTTTADSESFSDGTNTGYHFTAFNYAKTLLTTEQEVDKVGVNLYGTKTLLANGCIVEVYGR